MSSHFEDLANLCRKFGVLSLYSFGSRAEEARAYLEGKKNTWDEGKRDLDIGITPAEGKLQTWHDHILFIVALEELFSYEPVDLVIIPRISPFLAVSVIRGELLYCDNLYRQAMEELYILRRAADLIPIAEQYFQALLRGDFTP